MPLRITGMSSGLDIDSLVRDLTINFTNKKTSVEKAQTKLQWKQDAWKDMNLNIYNFYSNSLSKMRFSQNYNKKVAEISEEKIVDITVDENVNLGTHNLIVEQTAQCGYLTGKELNNNVNSDTLISSMITIPREGTRLNINGTIIEVTEDTTIGSLVKEINQVFGVGMSYDNNNHRFFMNSSETGEENDFSIGGNHDLLDALGLGEGSTRIKAKNAKIKLDEVEYENSSNFFKINGVSITTKKITSKDGTTINIVKNNSANLEIVKNFIENYNSILVQMQTSYNAESASKYNPLSDEEKEIMTDSQIEKWEQKIKKGILAKDNTLSSLISIFKNSASKAYKIDGEKLSLYSLGISSGEYLTTDKNERGKLNIDEDKLNKVLQENPDKVQKLLTCFADDLYKELSNQTKSTELRSAFKFYNDKQYAKENENYNKKINELEKKLQKAEDKYYKQFSLMETMLSKLQTQNNNLSSFFFK